MLTPGPVDLAELLSLLRLRAQRVSQKRIPYRDVFTGEGQVIEGSWGRSE